MRRFSKRRTAASATAEAVGHDAGYSSPPHLPTEFTSRDSPRNNNLEAAAATGITSFFGYASESIALPYNSPKQNHHHFHHKHNVNTNTATTTIISPRMRRISKPFVHAVDCFVILILIQAAIFYFLSDGHEDANDNHSLILSSSSITGYRRNPHTTFQETFVFGGGDNESIPPCTPIQNEHDVSVSLAIPLVEKDLEKVPHHCRRWGIRAPISIAVWTDMSPDQVLNKLLSFPNLHCHPHQMTITTLSPNSSNAAGIGNVRNQLRNLAIQGASTTHVLTLDIHMWSSVDLYETLHTPKLLQSLAKDPLQTILIPAFELNREACLGKRNSSSSKRCSSADIPRNYDDMIVRLGEKAIYPMDPMDYELQGNTDYRSWVRQSRGSLLRIGCVSSSHRFQPFLVVRRCQALPPFQESLAVVVSSDDNTAAKANGVGNVHANDATWIAHILRLGYSMDQLGGEFVVYLPDSWSGNADEMSSSSFSSAGLLLYGMGKQQQTRHSIFRWLDRNLDQHKRQVAVCPDEELATSR